MSGQSSYIILLFVAGTIITGACNSIFTKFQDLQCVKHCGEPGRQEYFEEPVLQSIQMFLGELLCWLPVILGNLMKSKKSSAADETTEEPPTNELRPLISEHGLDALPEKKKVDFKTSVILSIPSTCDLLGTTLMNAGLLYTPISIYQMTRGSLILFVGLFSVFFLKRTINSIEWSSLCIVFLGVFLVGLSGWIDEKGQGENPELSPDLFVSSTTQTGSILLGITLIFIGIIFSACQFVTEEHILTKIEVEPMELVGWEGLYGWAVCFAGALIAYYFVGSKVDGREGPWDIVYAARVMISNRAILLSSILIMLSISSFNFFGISLTKKLSATARSTIDTSRTLLVWIISICVGWESFNWLQCFAFGLMVFGTLVFNGVITVDDWKYLPSFLKPEKPTKDLLIADDVEANINRY
ncbi:DEKNAAC102594 [Brettanomyces naardenensis]|uniref:DEKNAAC102594 n=1 Tax=Brettanomyces naardenensis TaxID=13370 RepID=A0A448YKW9_BRENA|nr:DEKNAAC102594 [Brettanomyces naardenensis]